MKKIVVNLFMTFIVISVLHFNASGQTRVYPDLKVTITSTIPDINITSDYAVYFDYSSCSPVNCSTNRRHKLGIYRDGDTDADIIYSETADTHKTTFHYELPTGPSSNHRYGLRYREYNHGAGSCDNYSWSGFKKNDSGVWEPNPATSAADKAYWFDSLHRYSVVIRAITAPIKSPTGIKASNKEFFDRIVLNWAKGSNIPDTSLTYRIYRDTIPNPAAAVKVGEVNGSARTWTDSTAVPNDVFYYWVTTCTTKYPNTSNNTNLHESTRTSQNAEQGSTKTITVRASDGDWGNSVYVQWDDLSSYFENIKIERGIPNSSERKQLAILNKNEMSYSDNTKATDPNGAIPGFRYIYFVTPIRSPRTFPACSDQGYIKPNGIIRGTVTSLVGNGVDSVLVCARPVSAIPRGAVDVPSQGYCTLSRVDGTYEIHDIYYSEQADFTIKPYKSGLIKVHDFLPDSTGRQLRLDSYTSSSVDFKDESVFSVSGKVLTPLAIAGRECGVQGVEILVNGKSAFIYTDENGAWKYTISEEGINTFKPVFKHHQFTNAQKQPESRLLINDDISNIDFTDNTIDSIKVKVQSGCGTSLANKATVQIKNPNGCYQQQADVGPSGLLTLQNLPARKYELMLTELDPKNSDYSSIMNQIGNKPVTVDLTVRDTADVITTRDSIHVTPADTVLLPNGRMDITPADTVHITVSDTARVEVIPKADFIYHSPINVFIDFQESGAEKVCDNKTVLMEQYKNYKCYFSVKEEKGDCPVTDGKLYIYDEVSDRGNTPDTIPIKNGIAIYTIKAGFPKISDDHNHEKSLYVIPKVGFVDAKPLTYWIMVTGAQARAKSFVTNSPEIPMLVLHDPPGDSSYVYVNKGATISTFFKHEVLIGGEGGVYEDLTVGYGGEGGFRAGGVIKAQATKGHDTITGDGWRIAFTFDEGISTSPSRGWIGHNGDVFVGASFNEVYSLADELTFDKTTCTPKLSVRPSVNLDGFNTTFIYTEEYIKNTLIPNFRKLYDAMLGGRDPNQLDSAEYNQAYKYYNQFSHWEAILAQNDSNRGVRAIPENPPKNISFSAGTTYSYEMTSDTLISNGGSYNEMVNANFALGAKIENDKGLWVKSEFGAIGKYRWTENTGSGTDSTSRRKVGYVLRDNDIGDFFGVDIKRDIAYGVPAFQLVSGTSSCPFEPGTQPRDDPKITIYPPEINNVPIGGTANFVANLTNYSQSGETRSYAVKVITNTNPDGAIVKLGGTPINNTPVIYTLNSNQTANIALTLEKGPYATHYGPIGIVMYPPCSLESATSDTVWIRVSFQTECSTVSLYAPGDGWLVNQNSNNILNVAFTGYDMNDARLQSITLQYKKDGGDWTDNITIYKESLKDNFYDFPFDVTALEDGAYRLRTKSYCGPENAISYSPERSGTIDRTSIAPFGYPTPPDGRLDPGDEISVTFDKNISCNLSIAYIKLFTDDSTEITVTPQCFGNKIILKPQLNFFEGSGWEGVRLNATIRGVKDLSGNVQEFPINWSFQVNLPTGGNPNICPDPGIQCPDNMSVASDPGFCGAQVFFPDIMPSPDCGGPGITMKQTGGLQSGYLFPIGVTTNSFLLTNAEGKTATCSFDVTVFDNEPPVISDLSAELYRLWTPNPKMIPVALNYTATDNCEITNCEIFAMSSDPDSKTGTRKIPVPIVLMDQHHILLSAGRSKPGEGREYTIFIRCRDKAGYYTQEKTTIYVPNDNMILKSTGTADQTELSRDISAVKPAQFTGITGNEPFTASVWPNPSNRNFHIEVISSINEKVKVSVIDILGRIISNMDVNGEQPASFGENLVPGVYFVTVRQGVYLKNFKVIKQ